MIRKFSKKIIKRATSKQELGARNQLIEELFYDFHRNRHMVYKVNFVRGICFGFGTVLGGTVVVAFIIWILAQFAGWFHSIGDYINQIINAMQSTR